MSKCHPCHLPVTPPVPTCPPAPAQDVARRVLGEDVTQIATPPNASSGWWARFTFNGITRYERGTYDLVGRED